MISGPITHQRIAHHSAWKTLAPSYFFRYGHDGIDCASLTSGCFSHTTDRSCLLLPCRFYERRTTLHHGSANP